MAMMVLLGCSGCTMLSPPIKMQLQATNTLNLNEENECSLPVFVRVYQLADVDKFERASFSDLWKNEKETLGNSLLSARQVRVLPETSLNLAFPQEEKAKYIALVAALKKPDGKYWRVVEPISNVMRLMTTKVMKVQVTSSTVELL